MVQALLVSEGYLLAGTNGGVFISDDNGNNWVKVNIGTGNIFINALAIINERVFAGSNGGVLIAPQIGTNFNESSQGLRNTRVTALYRKESLLFAGTEDNGVFLSTDNGNTWIKANSGITDLIIRSFTSNGNTIFAGGRGGVYKSSNNGASWSVINNGLTTTDVRALIVSASTLFAGTSGGVFSSSDNGANWSKVSNGLTNTDVYALLASDGVLYAGTSKGVFRSSDNGNTWIQTSLDSNTVRIFASSGSTLFAGTSKGLYISTNQFNDSKRINNNDIRSLATTATEVIFGTYGGGVSYASISDNPSWLKITNGLFNPRVISLATSSTNVFAGTNSGGVFRLPVSALITSAKSTKTEIPTHFNLEQNYPNPFNPSTTISFTLPSRIYVSLKIFDALGREVAVLVSEELPAGKHSCKWESHGMASGIYFYQIQAGTFRETKKLLLLK